jgi:hypothetical protein
MAVTSGGVGRFLDILDAALRRLALTHKAGLQTPPLRITLAERASGDAMKIESVDTLHNVQICLEKLLLLGGRRAHIAK